MTVSLRQRVSAAAHEFLPHANPLSVAQMGALVALVADRCPSTAIDIGCGPGSFSIDLASRVPVSVRAVDSNRAFLARARADAGKTDLVGRIEFIERPLSDHEVGLFDVVVCIGSSGAIGTPRLAIQRCKQLLTPTGTLVFAELVWVKKPPQEFLDFLGVDESSYWSREDGKGVLERCGLTVHQQVEASDESWRIYEDAVLAGRLRFAETLVRDDSEVVRNQAEAWSTMYELHGSSCLGFVAYVAQRAEP